MGSLDFSPPIIDPKRAMAENGRMVRNAALVGLVGGFALRELIDPEFLKQALDYAAHVWDQVASFLVDYVANPLVPDGSIVRNPIDPGLTGLG